MALPKLTNIHTHNPVQVTLRIMGTGARAAAKTWTLQEWAGSLAAQAGERDYIGQLHNLYQGVRKRWRYVMEAGERVPESPRAILGYVLGAEYNRGPTCPSPERCDVEATTWNQKGWGDCDDVSTLLAGAVLALGMTPLFRVALWGTGGHVSVVTQTPKGDWVSIDPVGAPEEPFGWAMDPGPGGAVHYFNLDAREVRGPSPHAFQRSPSMAAPKLNGPYLQGVDGRRTYAVTKLAGPKEQPAKMLPTYMMSPRGVPRQVVPTTHVVMVRPGDQRGHRVLTVPRYHARIFSRGMASDRAPAIDQFGEPYEYLAGLDAWAPMGRWEYVGCNDGRYSKYLSGLGRSRKRRRRARAQRRKMRRRRTRAFFKRAGKTFRKVFRFTTKLAARVLKSKVAKNTIGGIVGIFGVPQAVVNRVMNAASAAVRSTGKQTKFIKYVVTGKWKKAAKILLAVAEAARKGLAPETVPGFAGGEPELQFTAANVPKNSHARAMWGRFDADDDDRDNDMHWAMRAHDGRTYAIAPVAGIRMGEPAEVADLQTQVITPTPVPGSFYRIQKGDTPLGIAGKAYNLKAGSSRTAALRRIQNIKFNAPFLRPTKGDFEKKQLGDYTITTLAKFACDPAENAQGQKGSCRPIIWIPQFDEEPPERSDAGAEPVLPDVDDPVVPVPQEPLPSSEDDTESLPAPPSEPCRPGTYLKLVDNEWQCVADPDYQPAPPITPKPEPTPPAPEPEDTERPQTKEPPTPGLPEDLDIKRDPLCPEGSEAYWPSGEDGFGPHACRPVDAYEPDVVGPESTQPGEQQPGAGGLALASLLALALL